METDLCRRIGCECHLFPLSGYPLVVHDVRGQFFGSTSHAACQGCHYDSLGNSHHISCLDQGGQQGDAVASIGSKPKELHTCPLRPLFGAIR